MWLRSVGHCVGSLDRVAHDALRGERPGRRPDPFQRGGGACSKPVGCGGDVNHGSARAERDDPRWIFHIVFIVLALLLLASLLLLHEPTRKTYVDPYTGILFDDGGVQGDYIADEALDGAVLAGGNANVIQGAHGGVIMSKLGNETAK